jgi:hypothetical protein
LNWGRKFAVPKKNWWRIGEKIGDLNLFQIEIFNCFQVFEKLEQFRKSLISGVSTPREPQKKQPKEPKNDEITEEKEGSDLEDDIESNPSWKLHKLEFKKEIKLRVFKNITYLFI